MHSTESFEITINSGDSNILWKAGDSTKGAS